MEQALKLNDQWSLERNAIIKFDFSQIYENIEKLLNQTMTLKVCLEMCTNYPYTYSCEWNLAGLSGFLKLISSLSTGGVPGNAC